MLDFDLLLVLSHRYCVELCAFLVPANLFATFQTLLFAAFNQPRWRTRLMAGVASFYALIVILHVVSWFAVGVVAAPTYILILLASVCLCINYWAVSDLSNLAQWKNNLIGLM